MNREECTQNYEMNFPLYKRFLKNISIVIEEQLRNEGISFLNFNTRIKTLDSFFEKVARKNHDNPFDQIEDFCGARIICYYPRDVEKIASLLRKEFVVHSEENTSTRLKSNEFGYRSTHLIISIPSDWLTVPQYRGLNGIKAEIQVRTVLMHAWAEIQHKLAYKSAEQVPDAFQRKLFRLSAKFEEADEQLEDIRNGLNTYRSTIKPPSKSDLGELRHLPLNLDTLTILLDTAYPEKNKSESRGANLLDELTGKGLSMNDLIDAIATQASISYQLENDECNGPKFKRVAQVGALRFALDISNDIYYNNRARALANNSDWYNLVQFGRHLLGKQDT